jgi:ubiquinone/menaquinone biosynthesis C-methylase UbiE
MDRSDRFWDRIAERYAKRPVADQAAYQKKLQVTRKYFQPNMAVLEIGCGTGSTAIAHAPYVKHILAIDTSSKMIEIARGKAEAGKVENVTFRQSTIEDFHAPDRSFDAVLGLNILHLLDNKEEVIAKVHRMLKPGGIFVTSTACIGDTMKFFRFVVPIGKFFGLMPTVKVFTTKELENSLTGFGFAIDYQWQPGKGKAVFIVARKRE